MGVVFDLTPMTRRADAERKIIIQSIETDKRRLWVAGLGSIPGMVIGGLLAPLIGAVAIVPIMLTAAAAIWLFDSRSRKGLRLRHWDAINDRRKAKAQFLFCGHVIHPGQFSMYRLVSLSAPVPKNTGPEWFVYDSAPSAHLPMEDGEKNHQLVAVPSSADGW